MNKEIGVYLFRCAGQSCHPQESDKLLRNFSKANFIGNRDQLNVNTMNIPE